MSLAAIAALIAALVTAASPPQHVDASSAAAQPAIQRLPGPIDTVIADPANLMYRYGPTEAERFQLEAENAFTSDIQVSYDAGFIANPPAQQAFQAAVDIWRSVIVSPAVIHVNAMYKDLGNPNILGSAGASFVCTVAGGMANTYYAAALADKINGVAFCSTPAAEINANFNSTFTNWDFGTAGVPVSGKYNFLTVVMHELGHGLGFFGSMTASGGIGSFGFGVSKFPHIYDRFAVTGAGAALIGFTNPSAALGAQLVSNNTFFNGTNARANNGAVSPKLETHHFTNDYGRASDNGWSQGSSYSHLDDVLYTGTPNGLMTYALGTAEVYTDPGPIMRGMFLDEGWSIQSATSAPSITSQPASQTIVSGSTATMNVTATGTAPLAYQWYVGTSGNTSTPVGTNSNSFTTPPLTTTTNYWVRVSNGSGTADSNTATITVNTPPAITSQPANQTVKKGQPAQFTVAASGSPAPTYQWQVSTNGGSSWSNLPNGAPYSGVTTTTLMVSTTTLAMSGTRYRCIATNVVSSATSNSATLTVLGSGALTDFDGDVKADLAVFRPSTGNWFIDLSTSNYTTFLSTSWGTASDIPVPADYDGDGKADVAIFRPSTGFWYILTSSSNFTTFTSTNWGVSTDLPVARDYDGDGKADIAVYRPSTGNWFVLQSSNAALLSAAWGTSTDTLVPGDYDGDGKADFAIYRPSTGAWFALQSSTNFTTFLTTNWGAGGDLPEPGDYDGDGKTDVAIFRPSTGAWYMLQSSTNNSTFLSAAWGTSTDVPVAGDFDGDGKADVAVYRPSTGAWLVLQSSSNFTTFLMQTWGTSTDVPLPRQ